MEKLHMNANWIGGCGRGWLAGLAIGLAGLGLATPLPASTVTWTDWTTINVGDPGGSALGTLSPSGQPPVTVGFSGDVEPSSQTSDLGNYDYWTPTSTWAGAAVPDAPTNPGIIGLFDGGGITQTLTFSQPIVDPVMALFSLGNAQDGQVTYTFNAPFTILSGGPSDSYGGSSIYQLASNMVVLE
jgi:hypothetical protein